MTHDPLCPFSVTQAQRGNRCGWCDVIDKVRVDEKTQAGNPVASLRGASGINLSAAAAGAAGDSDAAAG